MRKRLLVLAAVAVFGVLALVGGAARPAIAAPYTWNWIVWSPDGASCVQDPGGAGQAGDGLVLGPCGSAGTEWGPSASSYENYSGWDSIVAKNESHGMMCITDVGGGTDGVQFRLEGCNGSQAQAFEQGCDSTGDYDVADSLNNWHVLDLYGDRDTFGTPIVSWHEYPLTSTLPDAEQFGPGPWNSPLC